MRVTLISKVLPCIVLYLTKLHHRRSTGLTAASIRLGALKPFYFLTCFQCFPTRRSTTSKAGECTTSAKLRQAAALAARRRAVRHKQVRLVGHGSHMRTTRRCRHQASAQLLG